MAELLGNIFAPLTGLIGGALELLHDSGMPWWLSIAALTMVVRAALLPLTLKQVKNTRSMQSLRPRMEEIKARHKDSRQQQQAMAELYRENGVNPAAGFLPLLVQMPVFITMYHVIRDHNESLPSFAHGGMLWFTDLTRADPYLVLPVLSAGLMLAAMEISSKNASLQQRRIMRIMPLAFTAFIARFPAGLFVYWVTSNTVTLVQNLAVSRLRPPAVQEASLPEPEPAKDSASQKNKSAKQSAKRKRRKKKKRR